MRIICLSFLQCHYRSDIFLFFDIFNVPYYQEFKLASAFNYFEKLGTFHTRIKRSRNYFIFIILTTANLKKNRR